MEKNLGKIIFALIVLLVLRMSFFVIRTGDRGLLFTMGKIHNTVKTPGVYMKLPLVQGVEKVSIQPMEKQFDIDVDANGAITKDNQTIGATIISYYRYNEESLVEMRSKFGRSKLENIIEKIIYESFKEVVGDYDIFDIASEKEKIRKDTFALIKEKFSAYPIELVDTKITNYDWSDRFDAQIEETMERAQQVKQKQQEVLISEQEAQKKVKQSEAKKQSMILEAEGEKESAALMAEAKALEGEGIKNYNELVQKNMKLEVQLRELEIEKMRVEKRDGKYVPNNMYGPIPVDTAGGVKGK